MKLKRDRISSIILLAENMIKLFFLCLLVNMHITLSFQSDEDWSFEEDSKSSQESYESPFMSRIFGGKEAVPRNFSTNIEFDNFRI